MTTTVPLSALATRQNDTLLTEKNLCPQDSCLGLDACTIEPTHKRSILEVRSSMQVPFPDGGAGSWTLIPTEETLVAMQALQLHNITVPVFQRKSFLAEFSAREYEYIFVPLYTSVDFFILRPGQEAQQLSAPYTDFPRVTSSANPFFVTFDSRLKIQRFHVSKPYHESLGHLRMHWHASPLPEDFLRGDPETVIYESDDESEPDALFFDPETVATPIEEERPWSGPGKNRVCEWVQRDAKRPRMDATLSIPPPPIPQSDRKKKFYNTMRAGPRWPVESKRGKRSPHVPLVTALS
ncbi:hypothetical protein C8R45DRAFT_930780 [Mycena sanguinolenta]|nr:hypothetical protein C8R45DRAFT_930780 [Mycena sanguinolenta]